ncbi:MAG: glycosyl hydrolase family 18 protein [Synergistaceae bacterium]
MKNKIYTLIAICFLLGTLLTGVSFAAEGDIPVELTYASANGGVALGTGFYRGADLWISENAVKRMNVPLYVSSNNRNFIINVNQPAEALKIPALARLAGSNLSLIFPLLKENGENYFNISNNLSPVTKVTFIRENGKIKFSQYSPTAYYANENYKPINQYGRVTLIWDHVTKTNKDLSKHYEMSGVNVISPTWFNLSDGNGSVANRASMSYVEAAHAKGYSVWAIFSNGFSKVNTTFLFRNPLATNLYIARVLAYAKLYNLDGINIDFENVDVNDRNNFVSFIALLSDYTRPMGLKLSVDVHVPSNSNISRSHDRGSLSKYVDYVMLMAYDEHWRTCPRSGSVASMPWVEKAVQNTLRDGVPASKLVLGVPFYMRLWEETRLMNGKVAVKAQTLTMAESDAKISKLGLNPIWDDRSGQYFYSYNQYGKTYKVWVENKKSLEIKATLIDKYSLAGIAGWRLGHNTPYIFPLVR